MIVYFSRSLLSSETQEYVPSIGTILDPGRGAILDKIGNTDLPMFDPDSS